MGKRTKYNLNKECISINFFSLHRINHVQTHNSANPSTEIVL